MLRITLKTQLHSLTERTSHGFHCREAGAPRPRQALSGPPFSSRPLLQAQKLSTISCSALSMSSTPSPVPPLNCASNSAFLSTGGRVSLVSRAPSCSPPGWLTRRSSYGTTAHCAANPEASSDNPQGSARDHETPSAQPPSFIPDPSFDLRQETMPSSEAYVSEHHPELIDLLKRAWRALSLGEQLRMLRVMTSAAQLSKGAITPTPSLAAGLGGGLTLDSANSVDEASLEALERDDVLSELFRQLGHYFPNLLAPLVYERDAYLAWSTVQSRAVRGCRSVVSVMGRGHLRGATYLIMHKGEVLRFPLVSGQEGEASREQRRFRVVRRVVLELMLLGVGVWLLERIS